MSQIGKIMNIGNFKGALLEYIVRELLKNCGFSNVKADNVYSFERGGLFFVNGKGAAHDADIIMNPPIQMPFNYPTQIIFECKAYKGKAGLPIVRNALGLRNDLNDFEIVTKNSLIDRQNNRRKNYAVETRNRFLYQVGVAILNDYSKPAIEFSANNKIPLLSLSWLFPSNQIDKINNLTQDILDNYDTDDLNNIYDYFKDRNANINGANYQKSKRFLEEENEIANIVSAMKDQIINSFVGILETGDIIFLKAQSSINPLSNSDNTNLTNRNSYKAKIHYNISTPNQWELTLNYRGYSQSEEEAKYDFFVPDGLMEYWKKFNLDKNVAIDIKGKYFSKIFVFNQRDNYEFPFSMINLDNEWFNQIRDNLE